MLSNAEDSDFDVNALLGELSDDDSDTSDGISHNIPRVVVGASASEPPSAAGLGVAGEETRASPIETLCTPVRTSLQSRPSKWSSQPSKRSLRASQARSAAPSAGKLCEEEEEEEDEDIEEEEKAAGYASNSGSSSARSGSGSSSVKSIRDSSSTTPMSAAASAALNEAPCPGPTYMQQSRATSPTYIGSCQVEDGSNSHSGTGKSDEHSLGEMGSADVAFATAAPHGTGVAAVLIPSRPVKAAIQAFGDTVIGDVTRISAASCTADPAIQKSADVATDNAADSSSVQAEPTEAAPVTVKRPSPRELTKVVSRSSLSHFLTKVEETSSSPARTPFGIESEQTPQSLDVTLLPVHTPDSYLLTEEHLLPAAAPVPASWAAGSIGGLGQRLHAPAVCDNQLKGSSCGCAGGSASSSRSASFCSERISDESPPQTPCRSTRQSTSSVAASLPPKVLLPLSKKSSGLAVSAAASMRTSRGSGILSARSSRPSPRIWNEPGAAPTRGLSVEGCGPEGDGGLWIPSDGASNSRVSEPDPVLERAANTASIPDDKKTAMSMKINCAWVAASAAAAVATISRLEEAGDYCDGGPVLGGVVPGRPPGLGGPAAVDEAKRSALQVLAAQQVRVEEPQSPPAERSVPQTMLARRKRIMSAGKPVGGGRPPQNYFSARLQATHQPRRSFGCKNTAFTHSLPVQASAPSDITTKARSSSAHLSEEGLVPARPQELMGMQQQRQQQLSASLSSSMSPKHLGFAENEAVCAFSADLNGSLPAPAPTSAKKDENATLRQLDDAVLIGSSAQLAALHECSHVQASNDCYGAVPIIARAPQACLDATPAAVALGRLAEAKQKAMRLREQLGALSAYCDKLETAAGCFNKASAGSLGPAHAAAMRAAADQLSLASAPSHSSEEAVTPGLMALAEPLGEAVAQTHGWVGVAMDQRNANPWHGMEHPPMPAQSPCAIGCGLGSFSFPAAPDEGAGPISTAASPIREHQDRLSMPPLSHWLADAVGNLFPESLNLFQFQEASHSGFRGTACVPTAAW